MRLDDNIEMSGPYTFSQYQNSDAQWKTSQDDGKKREFWSWLFFSGLFSLLGLLIASITFLIIESESNNNFFTGGYFLAASAAISSSTFAYSTLESAQAIINRFLFSLTMIIHTLSIVIIAITENISADRIDLFWISFFGPAFLILSLIISIVFVYRVTTNE